MIVDFIETLKSLGGVKPCLICGGKGSIHAIEPIEVDIDSCRNCHGTGQILDLAPLLAKPWVLDGLIGQWLRRPQQNELFDSLPNATSKGVRDSVYVVGPQHAHSLVYEVARQLGGTCVTVSCEYDDKFNSKPTYWDLSLPIPPDATVLFVTDRVDNQEMLSCMRALYVGDGSPEFGWARKILPHTLALVANTQEFDGVQGQKYTVISLHKETGQ
jgi:hypothetical protein